MNVNHNGKIVHYRTVSFDEQKNSVVLIDQKILPHTFSLAETVDYVDTARAISDMTVRGAGAIGATAAYGLAQGARAYKGDMDDLVAFNQHVQKVFETLSGARPTAVDPVNAMKQILHEMEKGKSVAEKQEIALRMAYSFANEDVEHCRAIGKYGSKLIHDGMGVLTHCNAGWLAFVDVGSATAPIYAAQEQGKNFHVYCDETRPRSQGAILTAYELAQQGIPHHIIPDNAAAHLMQRGKIQLVITGADRVLAKTGEAANKIGTLAKAISAHYHNIPFYIAIPMSTIDWNMESGMDIPIEERSQEEVRCAWGALPNGERGYVRVANPTSPALNPGFDVTPAELITGFITPMGIIKPSELKNLKR